jgi:citrate synthase
MQISTSIATSDASSVTIRGLSLVNDLIGKRSFTEMVFFLTCGAMPTTTQTTVLDACLVTLMEHGFTPSTLVTRLAADCVPDQVQIAMASGLLTIGGRFVGTMEGCAALLAEGMKAADKDEWCRVVAADHLEKRKPMPGFGHPFHKPDDPRTPRLFEVALAAGVEGHHIRLLKQLSGAVDAYLGKHLTINATGAIGALLMEVGIPVPVMRAMAVVSRCGGLAGHILEEHETHSARLLWKLAEDNIPYAVDRDQAAKA